jgi:hypothetical protein
MIDACFAKHRASLAPGNEGDGTSGNDLWTQALLHLLTVGDQAIRRSAWQLANIDGCLNFAPNQTARWFIA